MNLSPISYQSNIKLNNRVSFKSKSTLAKNITSPLINNLGNESRKSIPLLKAFILTAAGFLGIKKLVDMNKIENNKQITNTLDMKDIENIKAEKVETWEEFFQKIDEIEALGSNNLGDKKYNQILEIKNLSETKTGNIGSPITVNAGIQQINQEIRLRKKAEVAKKLEVAKQAEKKAAKNAKITQELEKVGIVNIKQVNDKKICFENNGINYTLTNNSSEKINLYKVLTKSVNGEMIPNEIKLSAIVNKKEYDCDWKPGEHARITENLCKLLEDNPKIAEDKYFQGLLENYVNVMTAEESSEFLMNHKDLALKTEKGNKALNALKISKPDLYIDMATPEVVYQTEEGKSILKKYRPEAYDKLEEAAELERKIDELAPPAETIEVINYSQEVKEKPEWCEGHWDYDTAPNGANIESSKYWVPGFYTSTVYTGRLEYKYNGQTESIARSGCGSLKDSMLNEVSKKINEKRDEIRNELKKSYSYSKKARLEADAEMWRIIDLFQPSADTIEVVEFSKNGFLTYKYNNRLCTEFGSSFEKEEDVLKKAHSKINAKREQLRKTLIKSEGYDIKIKGKYNSEGKSILEIAVDWLQPLPETIEIVEYSKRGLTYKYNGKLLCEWGSPYDNKEDLTKKVYTKINQQREQLKKRLTNSEDIFKKEEPWRVGSWFGDKVCAPVGTDMSSLHVPTGTRLYYGPGDLRNGRIYHNPYDIDD